MTYEFKLGQGRRDLLIQTEPGRISAMALAFSRDAHITTRLGLTDHREKLFLAILAGYFCVQEIPTERREDVVHVLSAEKERIVASYPTDDPVSPERVKFAAKSVWEIKAMCAANQLEFEDVFDHSADQIRMQLPKFQYNL